MKECKTGFFEIFHEVSRAVLSALSVHVVTHLIAKRIVAALGIKASALFLLDDETGGFVVAASHLLSHEYISREPLEGDPGISEVLEGRPFQMEEISDNSLAGYREVLEKEGIRAILSVPMILEGRTIGALRLYSKGKKVFSDDELELISAIAEIGAVAIENARLFEAEGAKLSELLEKGGVPFEYDPPVEKYRVKAVSSGEVPPEKSYRYFNRLHKLAGTIASHLEVDRILEITVKEVADVMDVKGCSLLWLNFSTNELELVATTGLSKTYLEKGPLQVDRSIPQVLEGDEVFIPNASEDSRIQYPQAAENEGIVSILSVPIIVKEKVRGVLRLYSSDPRSYQPYDTEFVKALAEIGGIAILNGKLYQARNNDYSFWRSTIEYLGVEEEDAGRQ
jgi:signal transduction protein with GAF and PtsI domain